MWIICGVLSVLFCVLGWVLFLRKKSKTAWASACSLVFVSLTLLMEYRLVVEWVNKEDWGSLTDVVPTMYSVLTGYIILMFIANIVPIVANKKKIALNLN